MHLVAELRRPKNNQIFRFYLFTNTILMTNQTTSIYLLSNDQDIHWGLTVSTVGYQHIAPGEAYPPKGHPQAYSFQAGRGRVLDEYQFVYISRGRGVFESKSFGQATVGEGDLSVLHPLSTDY